MAEWIQGMGIGTGINLLTGKVRGDAVTRTAVETGGQGQRSKIALSLVESQEDIKRAIDFSSEVDLVAGLGEVSPKLKIIEDCAYQSNSIYLVAYAMVLNSFQQMRDVQLNDYASDLMRRGRQTEFREAFGDAFVRGKNQGGEFSAILRVDTTGTTDRSNVTAELNAAGVIGEVGVNTNNQYSEKIAHAIRNHQVDLFINQVGGNQEFQAAPQFLMDHALTFARDLANTNTGWDYQAFVIDYKSLPIPEAPNFIQIQNAKETIDSVMKLRQDVLLNLNSINYILLHPAEFNAPALDQLNTTANKLRDIVATLTDAASRCANDITDCAQPHVDIPDVRLPDRLTGLPPVAPNLKVVPDVVGQSVRNATDLIGRAGFIPLDGGTVPVLASLGPDPATIVQETEPPAGTLAAGNTTVIYRTGRLTVFAARHVRAIDSNTARHSSIRRISGIVKRDGTFTGGEVPRR